MYSPMNVTHKMLLLLFKSLGFINVMFYSTPKMHLLKAVKVIKG